ncbi:hypothetical protein ABB37_04536 [Leptomonas pyrrhocoris]|uniref:Transmembrane protein n=1 Tax=Leptomonas pyrrhocoris TaxID=157538 RepID=A0A0M9G349_LEPPY|nr:hypothetical protein ABB37_04536 [Leptomonas pyrrhocoris]KPA81199.1 hypothetical protein ABB37_04536 [Leptomonas pyrrhocoris]|eukprot:XP_015659638.1 hypothetical protein ABB37_04536 [Leptomonas pyrrhocoris]
MYTSFGTSCTSSKPLAQYRPVDVNLHVLLDFFLLLSCLLHPVLFCVPLLSFSSHCLCFVCIFIYLCFYAYMFVRQRASYLLPFSSVFLLFARSLALSYSVGLNHLNFVFPFSSCYSNLENRHFLVLLLLLVHVVLPQHARVLRVASLQYGCVCVWWGSVELALYFFSRERARGKRKPHELVTEKCEGVMLFFPPFLFQRWCASCCTF